MVDPAAVSRQSAPAMSKNGTLPLPPSVARFAVEGFGQGAGLSTFKGLVGPALTLAECCAPDITAHDAVTSWMIGDAKMKEDREVRCQVARTEVHIGIVILVAAV